MFQLKRWLKIGSLGVTLLLLCVVAFKFGDRIASLVGLFGQMRTDSPLSIPTEPHLPSICAAANMPSAQNAALIIKEAELPATQGIVHVTYDEESATILVQEGTHATWGEISQSLARPDLLSELEAGEWLLRVPLLIQKGATVQIAAPDVRWLKLLSGSQGFVSLKVRGGNVTFSNTCVTSWNMATRTYDQEVEDGRSFVLARDGAQMRIQRSELSYLGYPASESYGVAWRLAGTQGEAIESIFKQNYYGLYSYEVSGLIIRGNEVYQNIKYGIDPHTHSNHLVIEDNISHHNGKHGIILAEACQDSLIRNNHVYANTLHGIVLYQDSNNNLIEGNKSYANGLQGININGASHNTIRQNTISQNHEAGIGLGKASQSNMVDNNLVYENQEDGIYLFTDATNNVLQNNRLYRNARYGIYIKSEGNFIAQGNDVTGNWVGVYLNVESAPPISWEANRVYDNLKAEVLP